MNVLWPKAILLDFYGTVVEEIHVPVKSICNKITETIRDGITEREVVSYWVKVFLELCSQSHGDNFRLQKEIETQSLKEALEHFNIPLDAHVLSQSLSDYRAHPVLFPESRDVLSRCRSPICLVTNIDNAEIQTAINHLNLHFDHVITSEDCRAYKPNQELFETALSRLNLSPGEVLHAGDSWEGDVLGAFQAGIPVLWIDRRKRPVKTTTIKPDYTADDLNGLLRICGVE